MNELRLIVLTGSVFWIKENGGKDVLEDYVVIQEAVAVNKPYSM